jgi:hypothetical protein
MPTDYQTAIQRLRCAGAVHVADELTKWRNCDGGLGGWDGWVKGNFSQRIIAIIWGEEGVKA